MGEKFTRGYCQIRMQDAARTEGQGHLRGSHGDPAGSGEISFQPRDRCSGVYLALVVCGAGFLLPYNSFVTAVDFYHDRFPGTTIIFDISLTYIVAAFVSVVLNNLVVEALSLHARISFGYGVSLVTLVLIAVCDVWLDVFTPHTSYIVTLVAVAVIALGCTVQQSSFYGYTSMLPARYTQAVMTGESAAGLIVSTNRIITKAMMPDQPRLNTIIFFIISIATVCLCCVIFHVTRRTRFALYHVTQCRSAGLADDQRGITLTNPEEVDILDGNVSRDSYGVLVLQSPNTPTDNGPNQLDHVTNTHAHSMSAKFSYDNESQVHFRGKAYMKQMSAFDKIKSGCVARWRVARGVWPYMMSIGAAYFVTLCLFPGIESEVRSCRLGDWMPVVLMATFNLGDLIGKIVSSIDYDWPRGRLVLAAISRIVIVPVLMLCAAPRDEPILSGEGWAVALSALLGITNGYFGSVPMILAPSKVPDEQKELTGNIMTLSYSVGLTTGSIVAYLLDHWLGPQLTFDPCDVTSHNLTQMVNITSTTVAGFLELIPPAEMFPH